MYSSKKVAAFDAYGTLLDFRKVVESMSQVLGDRVGELTALWRRKQLEYTWLRSLMGRHADFHRVTADALAYALESLRLDERLAAPLMAAYAETPAFPDASMCLDACRASGLATCVLSNGSPNMLARALEHAGLTARLDAILSVEAVGIYKPAPPVYQLVCDRFQVAASDVLFVSANGWDVAGAASFGFDVAWLNREGAPIERLPYGPESVLHSLTDLAESRLRRPD